MAQRFGRLLVTVFGALPGRTVRPLMIAPLDPGRELIVKFFQAVRGITLQAQGALEVLLHRLNEPLTFAFAPTVVRLAMQQPYPQLGANHVPVAVNKGLALIGVKFARQAAAQKGFLESVVKSLGVG